MKKLFYMFTALTLFFLWQSHTAQADPLQGLEIEGRKYNANDLVNNLSGNGWEYDRASNTVTLNGYNSSHIRSGNSSSEDLNITLKGSNTINGSSGIYSHGNTYITADQSTASLTITATGPRSNEPLIGAVNTLVIDKGTIQLSHTYGNTTPNDAVTSLLKANNVEIIGNAKITAIGEAHARYSAGIGSSRGGGSLKIATARDVSIKMTAIEPTNANNIYAIYNNNLSDKAQFGGSGTYTFEAPSRALNIDSSLIDGQIITTPEGAYFSESGSMYDAGGTLITPAKVVIGSAVRHTLTVHCGSGGTCTPSTGDYLENSAMPYTFTANSGYVLDHFEITPHGVNSSYSGAPSVSGTFNFNQDKTIRVNFKAKNSNTDYAITTKSNAGGTISAPSKSKANQTVNVTAEPNTGYRLVSVQWYKTHEPATKHNITEAKSFTMPDAAVAVEAEFFPLPQYVINITCGSNGTCTKTPDLPSYYYGDELTVDFIAKPGYVIENIFMNGSPLSNSINQPRRSVTLNNLGNSHEFNATFKPAPSFM